MLSHVKTTPLCICKTRKNLLSFNIYKYISKMNSLYVDDQVDQKDGSAMDPLQCDYPQIPEIAST